MDRKRPGLHNDIQFDESNADSGDSQRRRTGIYAETPIGDEFYEFSMDNELYYLKSVPSLQSGVKCRDVEGQQQLPLLSREEVIESAAQIRMGVTTNE